MRFVSILVALGLLLANPAFAFQDDTQQYYRSTDGSMVHRPAKQPSNHYGPETAVCRDGSHSYSHHHRGTCSHHGGVAEWEG
jgi:hypothetical protein